MNRCDEGETLHKTWRDSVKSAAENWEAVMFKGKKAYDAHVASCYTCQQFENEKVMKQKLRWSAVLK